MPQHMLTREALERGAWQKADELSGLLELVGGQRLEAVLEIGTFKGGTLYCWCHLADPQAVVISIDLTKRRPARVEELKRFARDGQSLHLMEVDSHDANTLDEVVSMLGGRELDLLFIDGDHSYEGVKKDFDMYGRLVRSGGLIAFHDILPHPDRSLSEVDLLWAELKGSYRHAEITSAPYHWGGIGVLWQDGV